MTATIYTQWRWGGGAGVGMEVTQQSFIGGCFALRSNPLPVYIPFLTEFELGRVANKSSK